MEKNFERNISPQNDQEKPAKITGDFSTTYKGEKIPETASHAFEKSMGLGSEGLKTAQDFWQTEMNSRTDSARYKVPYIIEGKLDGNVVYREKGGLGNLPKNINDLPEGREEEIQYFIVGYDITR
ncbi:MAG: hypothetical protein A3F54_04280 [Candidatus Kerfeldbacteria bacterium RIFCSPHIGHO2_12_FULL_48_17]|uniref:Uncharacterized protein n=1 Tax=Candidatus Kerfeldbacteria bacterium RIFCSPHIGHO2_12_FULL_48_17 TaxID=1798542 RepID=A0A1G2B7G2_9BACT|nr:MAG: hypothetical protein A3F54_04280 [Candidatus Kerfeldbacteria bacterium RIFCSPHIGHO2_12_FULL_48_17]